MSLDSLPSPPPLLHYSSSSASDADSPQLRELTPATSVSDRSSTGNHHQDRGKPPFQVESPTRKDFFSSWTSKPADLDVTATATLLDADLIGDQANEVTFSLFPSSPQQPTDLASHPSPPNMASATPIDIGSRSNGSLSQTSNLTSALRAERSPAMNINGSTPGAFRGGLGRLDSNSGAMPSWGGGGGAMNIPQARRESLAGSLMNGSLMNGMSWGGISVGSFIRDDIMMAGTSPFAFQSPSQHSSSYLPKLEANFMKDFTCCNLTLPSLHDLLQHYEEAHAQKSAPPVPGQAQSTQGGVPDSRAALATDAAASVRQQAQQTQGSGFGGQRTQSPQNTGQAGGQTVPPNAFGGQMQDLTQASLDMDTVEDMEMDDALGETDSTPPGNLFTPADMRQATGAFGQAPPSRAPTLNLGMLQNQSSFRGSQPTTPTAASRQLFSMHNNPTVSSVNTPTLMGGALQQFQTPDSSAPGTPSEFDDSMMGGMGGMGDLTLGDQAFNLTGLPMNGGMNNDNGNICIDDPAKRLFNPSNGANNSQQYAQFRLGNAQYGPNSDIAKRIREQQMLAGVPDPSLGMMPHEEPKPFRCPVIGCEKAYKNQNGLKYHKAHGHNTQQLHDNADGTFSIVNPETAAPYPGTMGMEKEKPYKCEVCGKRYKNLNGLKYHKSHSIPCNPDLPRNPAGGGVMHGQNTNIAGAGLPGFSG